MDFRNLLSSLNILCHATILYKIDYHKNSSLLDKYDMNLF